MKKIKAKNLFLFDHDGTLCVTNVSAYDSMKDAFRQALSFNGIHNNIEDLDWTKIFSETRGTTEKYFISYVLRFLVPDVTKHSKIAEDYYYLRSQWYVAYDRLGEFTLDTYYPDAQDLLIRLAETKDNTIWLVTGNPRSVVENRMANGFRKFFADRKGGKLEGVFGEEGYSRKELIEKAVSKAVECIPEFFLKGGDHGFVDNVFYIGDSRSDFFSGLSAKVKTIWIPSRKLQDKIDAESSMEISCIRNLLPSQFIITNRLNSKETLDFIENIPS